MKTIEKHVDIDIPAADAYAQWTQFEDLPRVMEHVEEVKQLDDRNLSWKAKLAGREKTWHAEITEQIPDKRIAWKTTAGVHSAGCVTFHRLDDATCRVMLQLDFEPAGAAEKGADLLGFVERGVAAELDNFKRFLETRGAPTGRWEGDVPSPDERARGSESQA